MEKLRGITLAAILLLASVLPASMAAAQEPNDSVLELTGTLNGAPFKILVPANWNGTLLIYAHGYGFWPEPSVSFPPVPVDEPLLEQGYAMAGSAFRNPGFAVKEGIQNTLALTNYFRGQVGNPERIILWGHSMGGLIAQAGIEKYPGVYDAAIPMCSNAAGATKWWDSYLGIGLAYEAAFGWPEEWGSVGDVRDDLSYWAEVYPVYLQQIGDDTNFGKFEFIRLVNGLPEGDFYSDIPPGLWQLLMIVTENRAELETRAGGPVSQNLDHVYGLSQDEVAYLNGLDVDAEALLEAMNARTNIQARRSARKYLERYANLTGEIKRPVLSMHTTVDSICAIENESAYRETVAAAGQEDMLVQVYTDGVGHCAFTPAQMLTTFAAMEHWLDTGERPDTSFFPVADGFDLTFEPPPWPQPPQP
jgi:pimeloyl-ACP methyl ester carboxylesterase